MVGWTSDSRYFMTGVGCIFALLDSPIRRRQFSLYVEDDRDIVRLVTALAGAEYRIFAPLAHEIRVAWEIWTDYVADCLRMEIEEEELGRDIDMWFPQQWGADSD